MARYRMYGLDLDSARELPGFASSSSPAAASAAKSWRIRLPADPPLPSGDVLRARDEAGNDDRLEVRRLGPTALGLYFGDGCHFCVDATDRTICGKWPGHFSFEDALVYVVGSVLGAAIRTEGRSALHASAVDVGGKAVLLMGDAGAGKSTLTARCVDAGHMLITEDVAAFGISSGEAHVFRGGTRIKLWEESVVALRGRADALPRLVPSNADWRKRYLDVGARSVTRESTPIRSIVLLERRSHIGRPVLEDVSPQERVLALVANAYGSRFVFPEHRAQEMHRLSQLARLVPVKRLVYADDIERLAEAALVAASA